MSSGQHRSRGLSAAAADVNGDALLSSVRVRSVLLARQGALRAQTEDLSWSGMMEDLPSGRVALSVDKRT